MRAVLDEACVLHIVPVNTTELVALKYWMKEYAAHGSKMIEVADTLEVGAALIAKSKM